MTTLNLASATIHRQTVCLFDSLKSKQSKYRDV
jgi:hypothetical protein